MSNPFVVDQLTPQNTDGRPNGTYQLSKASVSPTRIIGRDARGFPVEDTIPTAAKWGYFLMPDGCTNKVPLRTGSVPSMHADAIAYENEVTYDIVMAGGIPSHLCPYSTTMYHITKGPFAAIPPGEQDCGGVNSENGCTHLQGIAKARKAEVVRLYNLEAEKFKAESEEVHARMRADIVEGVGAAIAKHVSPIAQRSENAKRLKDGRGEVEG